MSVLSMYWHIWTHSYDKRATCKRWIYSNSNGNSSRQKKALIITDREEFLNENDDDDVENVCIYAYMCSQLSDAHIFIHIYIFTCEMSMLQHELSVEWLKGIQTGGTYISLHVQTIKKRAISRNRATIWMIAAHSMRIFPILPHPHTHITHSHTPTLSRPNILCTSSVSMCSCVNGK